MSSSRELFAQVPSEYLMHKEAFYGESYDNNMVMSIGDGTEDSLTALRCQCLDTGVMLKRESIALRMELRGGIRGANGWRDLFKNHHPWSKQRFPDHNDSRTNAIELASSYQHRTIDKFAYPEDPLHSRLGKSQLGKYAHEEQMPAWLVSLLKKDGEVSTYGVIAAVGRLLERSRLTKHAYLSYPDVTHVSKLRREGAFCGYRNIQMLISYITESEMPGWEKFGQAIPDIFQIQDMIENAWDKGVNSEGRIETGGIKGTRKYIGTPEAQAVFQSLGFQCSVQAFKDTASNEGAAGILLDAVEYYFQQDSDTNLNGKIHSTSLPPIYLQQPGHSMTIIGIERQMNNQRVLLVLDPAFRGSSVVKRFSKKALLAEDSMADRLLRPYRRNTNQLRKYAEFEVL